MILKCEQDGDIQRRFNLKKCYLFEAYSWEPIELLKMHTLFAAQELAWYMWLSLKMMVLGRCYGSVCHFGNRSIIRKWKTLLTLQDTKSSARIETLCASWYDASRRTYHFSDIPAQNAQPASDNENVRSKQEIFYSITGLYFQNTQGDERQRRQTNHSTWQDTKDTGQISTRHHPGVAPML